MSQRYSRQVRSLLSCVVILTMVLQPGIVLATSPTVETGQAPVSSHAKIHVADVELERGGPLQGQILHGQIVNDAGSGLADVIVQLSNGRQHWQTRSDAEGKFQLTGLSGGTYQLQAMGQAQLVRAWSAGTAPPHASQGMLMTSRTDVVRGQRSVPPVVNQFVRTTKKRLANPLVVGGIIATAVTLPIAIHNADDDDPPATP